jgi:hypothetical protein
VVKTPQNVTIKLNAFLSETLLDLKVRLADKLDYESADDFGLFQGTTKFDKELPSQMVVGQLILMQSTVYLFPVQEDGKEEQEEDPDDPVKDAQRELESLETQLQDYRAMYEAVDKADANECMTILHLIRTVEERMEELRKTIGAASASASAAAPPHAAPLQKEPLKTNVPFLFVSAKSRFPPPKVEGIV